jgi:hypothetical protein
MLCVVFLSLKEKSRVAGGKDSLRAFVYKNAGEWQQGFTVESKE